MRFLAIRYDVLRPHRIEQQQQQQNIYISLRLYGVSGNAAFYQTIVCACIHTATIHKRYGRTEKRELENMKKKKKEEEESSAGRINVHTTHRKKEKLKL